MGGTAAKRIALPSDCEGNIAALEAALRAMKAHAPDTLVVAGDILASPFSPDPPRKTIALLRPENVQAVPGNNDRCLIDLGMLRWPHTLWMRLRRSDPAGTWLEEVGDGQALIPPDDLAWLRGLPEGLLVTDGVWVCHGMPGNPWNSIWPRSPIYDANVFDADRDASLHIRARMNVELVHRGHVPTHWEYYDRLPDGRELKVVRARRAKRHVGVAGDAAPREEGQPHAAAQLEERDRAVLEFLADDALAGQPKPLPVERQRPLQVVDPERNDSDPRFQPAPPGGG
jgi:hypothetical protein